jgi:hypothetical protein|tara:strand:- start:595 stop:945 length:351 start_codon:yes stop_codon:yes gene_type:complete
MAGTGVRNRHKVGDYLMQDDESGLVYYKSEMVERWDGLWVHNTEYESRHPQEFIQARPDPAALRHTRPEPPIGRVFLALGIFVGDTSTRTITTGPAAHLFIDGIGDMVIGSTFLVR